MFYCVCKRYYQQDQDSNIHIERYLCVQQIARLRLVGIAGICLDRSCVSHAQGTRQEQCEDAYAGDQLNGLLCFGGIFYLELVEIYANGYA